MARTCRAGRVLCVAVALGLAAVPGAARAQALLSGETLVTALRQGGYNIYFRHAPTDWTQDDRVEAPGDWRSCDPARMRQLSDTGRALARRVGAAIRQLDIPVGRVLASEYCRAAETARLMGLGPVTTTWAIMNTRAADLVGGREAVIRRARELLSRPPAPGTNTVLVAHGNLMRAATGSYASEGGAGVFAPRSDGGVRLVAHLTPEAWQDLARRFAAGE